MADALVTHPAVGSVWLQNAVIEGDFVVGEVSNGNGFTEPAMATMNFPAACVRKWSGTHNGTPPSLAGGSDSESCGGEQ